MKRIVVTIFILAGMLSCYPGNAADDTQLSGRILLQVEGNGEAWYVNPTDLMRYYLGRPDDAFKIMRDLGVGISNVDLKRIPVGLDHIKGIDSDNDGLNDRLEDALGTRSDQADSDSDGWSDLTELKTGNNPLGSGLLPISQAFTSQHLGKIFLQIENKGEAWYVNPENGHRYFLGLPDDAFNLMRTFGLGITNNDLGDVVPKDSSFVAQEIEKQIHELINIERTGRGLSALVWNPELASVAREHSENLAKENLAYTGLGMSCDYPLIHHEGTEFGFYNINRLNSRGVNYFSKAAENIALLSRASLKIRYKASEPIDKIIEECQNTRIEWDNQFKSTLDLAETEEEKKVILSSERSKRMKEFTRSFEMNVEETEWHTNDYLATESVLGWMESPGHRENILNGEYDEAGVGAAYIDGYFIVTQVFIKRADCGFSGGACCTKEGYYPYCFIPLSCSDDICG